MIVSALEGDDGRSDKIEVSGKSFADERAFRPAVRRNSHESRYHPVGLRNAAMLVDVGKDIHLQEFPVGHETEQ